MPTTNRFQLDSLCRRIGLALLLLGGVAMCEGCGGGIPVPSTVPVRGVVNYQGKPAPGIRVTFHAQGKSPDKVGFVPQGQTGSDGSFSLSTGAPNNGAPLGDYIVTFDKPEIAPPEQTNSIETEIDALQGKYSDPQQSVHRATIVHGENNLPAFELN